MYRVVVVDDEKIIRIGMQSIIDWERNGFKVVGIASDGEQALEIIEAEPIDIVITDIKMPKMDGLTLVKTLKQKKFNGEIIMLTNYGEFELAREALRQGVHDYLLKATLRPEELSKSLLSIKDKLDREKGTSKKSEYKHDKVKEEEINQIKVIFEAMLRGERVAVERDFSEAYRFILIKRVKSKYEKQDRAIKPLESYSNAISNITREIISLEKEIETFYCEEWALCLLNKAKMEEAYKINEIALRIQNHIKMYTNLKVVTVVGEVFRKEDECEKFLECSIQASKLLFYKGYSHIILQQEYEEYKNYLELPQEKFINELKGVLEKGGYDEAIEVQMKWFEFIKTIRPEKEQVDQFFNKLMNEMIVDYGIYLDKEKDKLKEIAVKYRKCTTLDEIKEVLGELTYTICNYILHIKSTHYRREVVEIIEYINENISKKITLATLADEVNMNESYISRLFKSETGTNLVNYINMLKMEKAKELLKQPDMIVKDVANALGFEEQSYFNRMFKKHFGLNPKEYKKQV